MTEAPGAFQGEAALQDPDLDEVARSFVAFAGAARPRTMVIAGHYSVAPGLEEVSYDGVVEQRCFELGIRTVMKQRALGTPSRLLLWVNDIGIDPKARSRLKAEYQLPAPYRQLGEGLGFDPGLIDVRFESTMRNKGSVWVRENEERLGDLVWRTDATRPGLVRCTGDTACSVGDGEKKQVIATRGPYGEELVLKEGSHPKCCLILGMLFRETARSLGAERIINIFNGIYLSRIDYGVFVSRRLFGNAVAIENMFLDETTVHRGLPREDAA